MLLSTKLLNLLAVAIVAIHRSAVIAVSGEADDDSSLKQALFLVELLKSDFAKILRDNGNLKNSVVANSSEDNSTCPTPIQDLNSTNETGLIESGTSSTAEVWTQTSTVPINVGLRPEDPRLAFSSWPSMPIPGYPLPGPDQQRNFPAAENNFRFPYRFGRRRMMPDYYYYDSPVQSRGQFRRVNGPDPITADNTNATATTQEQTTTYLPSSTSEVTTLRVEETTTNMTSTSALQNAQPSSHTNSQLSNQTTTQLSTQTTAQLSTQTTSQSPIQTTSQSPIQTTSQSSIQPTTQLSTQQTQSKFGVRTPMSILKATSTIISNRHEKLKLNSAALDNHLRRRKTTTEKITSEDVVMSQVASELINEFKGTKSKNISEIFNQSKKGYKLHSKKKHSTTMKIYLKGSSRLPVPLPENNAFCHSYPHNALCGTML